MFVINCTYVSLLIYDQIMVKEQKDLATMCQTLRISENQDGQSSREDRSEVSSLSQISSAFANDEMSTLLLTDSTDLSHYMQKNASDAGVVEPSESGRSEECCTTLTESLRTISESVAPEVVEGKDKQSLNDNDKSNETSGKLVRRNSFTVETPSFKDLPSCDSLDVGTGSTTASPNNVSGVAKKTKVDDRKSKWCLNDKSFNIPCDSPIVSDEVAERAIALARNHEMEGFDADVIEAQVSRLKDMQIMLQEYHALQLEHLKVRQRQEVETLSVQIDCMHKLLSRLKKPKNFVSPRATSNVVRDDGSKSSVYPAKLSQRSSNNGSFSFTPSPIKFVTFNKSYSPGNRFGNSPPFAPVRRPSSGISNKRLFADGQVPEILKNKLAAYVKGYLLRRFLKVAKVDKLLITIKDVRFQLINLSQEVHLTTTEFQFGEVLVLQLKTSLDEFHAIMFETSLAERLHMIIADNETKLRTTFSPAATNKFSTPKRLSSATMKRLSCKTPPFGAKSTLESAKTKKKRLFAPPKRCGFLVSPRKSPSSYFANMKQNSLLSRSHTFSMFANNRKPWR